KVPAPVAANSVRAPSRITALAKGHEFYGSTATKRNMTNTSLHISYIKAIDDEMFCGAIGALITPSSLELLHGRHAL
ncbi:MAG: hypothetical protein WBE50_07305, partial [Methyloceanibacter sp.]